MSDVRRPAVGVLAAAAIGALVAGSLAACGNSTAPSSQAVPAALVAKPAAVPPIVAKVTAKPTPKPTPKPVKPLPPRKALKVSSVTPADKGPFGVALVVSVVLNHDVAKKARKAVQQRLVVSTSKRVGPASWAWIDNRTVSFRPRSFWPAATRVSVSARLEGLVLPVNADGVQFVGRGTKAFSFTISRATVTSIDGNTQMGTVKTNGKKVRSVPVSMGKSGWRTRNGIKAIMDRELNHVFTNTAVGDFSSPYRLTATYNLRLTYSGEFLHSAPWAEGRLGQWAGSHGCTNASDSDAGWFYHHALFGDPVIYKNTGGKTMELDNGMGGPWNLSWKKWLARSAAPAVPTWTRTKPRVVPAKVSAPMTSLMAH